MDRRRLESLFFRNSEFAVEGFKLGRIRSADGDQRWAFRGAGQRHQQTQEKKGREDPGGQCEAAEG
jgi:hypothetical protein